MTISNGVYASDGSLRYTVVSGSSWTGLFAADGSYNIVLDSVGTGIYHSCGAFRVSTTYGVGNYDSSGAFRLSYFQGVFQGAPFTFNLTRSNTSVVRSVYQANTRNTVIALSGDSTMRGVDETASPYASQYFNGPPMQLATKFNSLGINAGANNLYGWCGTSMNDYILRDSRVAITGSVVTGSFPCLGGAEFALTAAATLSFTPQDNTTTAEIYWKDAAAGVSWTWAVDGGSATTVNSLNNNSIRKTTISLGSAGAHTIVITWVSGNVRIYGIECYDDTAGRKEITFRQWGISGATASAMIDNTGTPSSGRLTQLTVSPADLIISECGVVNSWRNGTAVSTVETQLTTYVQAVKAAGSDFMFLAPPYDNGTSGATTSQDKYVAAMYRVALAQNVPLIDLRRRWISFSYAVTQGWMVNTDNVHPTKNGYIDQAYNVLLKPIQFAIAA